MTTVQQDLKESFPDFLKSIESISTFFSDLWSNINNLSSIVEIVVIFAIAFISYQLQKWIQIRYLAILVKEEKTSWTQRLLFETLSFTSPFIAFVLLFLAMSITAGFTHNLDAYKLSIKLTLIWFIWVFVIHTIPDLFVRWVVACILIPFLIFSTFGLSTPVLNYLDSLGFPLGGIHISILLILKGLLIATFSFWFARLICKVVISFIESQKKINPEVQDMLSNLFQVILYSTVALITLDLLGIDFTSLALIGGAIGIGIGLGLQKIAANFISGIIILFEQNIKVGHLVEIQGGGNPGWIRHLGARAAVIDTSDGKELLIPNEELLTKTLIDWTSKDKKLRTDLQIKVSVFSNLEKAKEIMLEAVTSHPLCSKSLPPSCFLEKFIDNSAQFLLQFWVDDLSIGKMDMQNDVLLTIWKRFAEENIEFPTPTNTSNLGVNG